MPKTYYCVNEEKKFTDRLMTVIRQGMAGAGLKQADLAEALNVAQPNIHYRLKTGNISAAELRLIALKFNEEDRRRIAKLYESGAD